MPKNQNPQTSKLSALILLSSLILGVFPMLQANELELRVMSFNVRNSNGRDGENRWQNRIEFTCETLQKHAADVVGLQEATQVQIDTFLKEAPQYQYLGTGAKGGNKGQFTAIMFRKDRFAVGESGSFWLSNTPNMPSKHWGNHHLRNCTWAKLTDKSSNQSFYVYNTHLDDGSQVSREKSVECISKHIHQHAKGAPFILMGDFNIPEDNPAITYLTQGSKLSHTSPISVVDSFRALHSQTQGLGTYHGFEGKTEGHRIDYIFLSHGSRTTAAAIDRSHKNGRYPSDHFPVTAHIFLKR